MVMDSDNRKCRQHDVSLCFERFIDANMHLLHFRRVKVVSAKQLTIHCVQLYEFIMGSISAKCVLTIQLNPKLKFWIGIVLLQCHVASKHVECYPVFMIHDAKLN